MPAHPHSARDLARIAAVSGLRSVRQGRLRRHYVIGQARPLTHCATTYERAAIRGRELRQSWTRTFRPRAADTITACRPPHPFYAQILGLSPGRV